MRRIVVGRGRIVVVVVVTVANCDVHAGETVGHGRMVVGDNVVGQRRDLAVVQQLIGRRHPAHGWMEMVLGRLVFDKNVCRI